MPLENYGTPKAILWRPGNAKNGAVGAPNLYWAHRSRCPAGEGVVAYSTDDKPQFIYESFNHGRDFGPLDIARTVMYCRWVEALCNAHVGCVALVHVVSDTSGRDRVNTVALCGAFLIFCEGASAEEAARPFAAEPLPGFVDCRGEAVPGAEISEEDDADFTLSVLDVMRGLEKSRDLGWVDHRIFDVEEHSSSLRPERGDMSWLLPGKALALASPWAEPQDQDGLPVCTPALLCPYFLRNGVSLVVQCNNPEREEEGARRRLLCYDAQNFRDVGVQHLFMPFEDGGCPSVELVLQFMAHAEAVRGAFAVHCRSGLGRTATLIGIYAIRHLGFTARGFIGWARCMRPGTVHGSQQQYLANMEPYLRPGAHRTLEHLDERERLLLLPRRELRFWALDCGIAASRTRLSTESEMVEMILAARGIRLPLTAPVPAAPPSRSLAPVLRTQAQVAASKPSGVFPKRLSAPTQVSQATPMLSAPKAKATGTQNHAPSSITGDHAASAKAAVVKVPPEAPPPANAELSTSAASGISDVARGLNNITAALASLDTTNGKNDKERNSSQQGDEAKPLPESLSTGSAPSRANGNPSKTLALGSSKEPDEWAEVLRYLHLFTAMQAGNAWESVRQITESLRDKLQALPSSVPENTVNNCQSEVLAEIAMLREAHRMTSQKVCESQAELRVLQQQAESLQRETSQLRAKFLRDQEAQLVSQTKMEERSQALAATLHSDEARLESAVRDVEELRGHVLRQGGLAQWQVDRVEQLRRDIAEARAATSQFGAGSRDLRARLETLGVGSLGRH